MEWGGFFFSAFIINWASCVRIAREDNESGHIQSIFTTIDTQIRYRDTHTLSGNVVRYHEG